MWYCNYVTWGKKDDHIIEQYRHIYIYIHVSFEDTYLNISTHIFYHITIYHFKYCNIWTIMHTSAYCTYINTTSHLYVYVYMHTYIYVHSSGRLQHLCSHAPIIRQLRLGQGLGTFRKDLNGDGFKGLRWDYHGHRWIIYIYGIWWEYIYTHICI